MGGSEEDADGGGRREDAEDDQAEPVNHLDRQLHGKLLSVMENKYSSLPSCKSNLSGVEEQANQNRDVIMWLSALCNHNVCNF